MLFRSADPIREAIYIVNQGLGSISSYNIDTGTGTLEEAGSPSLSGNNVQWVATDPHGKFLYTTAKGDDTVAAFKIHANTGTLETIEISNPTGDGPAGLAVDPTGNYLYVTNVNDSSVSAFKINASGALTAGGTFPAGSQPYYMTTVRIIE